MWASGLLNEKYKLPQDFESNERVKKLTLEDIDMEDIEMKIYKYSHLNSRN